MLIYMCIKKRNKKKKEREAAAAGQGGYSNQGQAQAQSAAYHATRKFYLLFSLMFLISRVFSYELVLICMFEGPSQLAPDQGQQYSGK